jgi:hypothetical protein
VAISALASIIASSASAACPCLPTILLLSEGKLPILILSEKDPNTIKTELQSEAETLAGEGLLLDIMITNLNDTSDGSYLVLFLKVARVKGGKEKCNTAGDQSGEILIPTNLIHLVYDSLTPLGVGTLFLVAEFEVKCGTTAEPQKLKLKIKGETLGLIEPINTEAKEGEFSLKASLHCLAGIFSEPKESKYWNSSGTLTTAVLLANTGGGFEKACEEIVPTTIPIEPMTMIEIDG